jgi:hypothetical protein
MANAVIMAGGFAIAGLILALVVRTIGDRQDRRVEHRQ